MKPSRSTILVLILVSVCIVVQAVLGNIVATQLQDWLGPWDRYVLPAFLLITSGLIVYTVRDQLSTSSDVQQRQAHNRRVMLEQVWQTWIKHVLQTSLYRDIPVPLNMQSHPDAVRAPRTAAVQRLQQAAQPLRPDASILEVFDDAGGALLILGAPGSGKTTLLLELARDLIERAGHEATHPIPVVFPLSTWAASRQLLDQWLTEELVERYAVPHAVAKTWIMNDVVLPLLDGLDEVAPSAQDACVDAINVFRAVRGNLPIVVCSRITDYNDLAGRLRLHAAIIVQPLSREQVRQYVRDIGLRLTPSSTSPLWYLLTTPLMLNIATLAYVDQPEDALRVTGSWEEMQEQIIAAYVEHRISQAPDSQYLTAHMKHYLAWLAWQMQRHNQTVFYMEHMQPAWLPQQQRWLPKRCAGLASALVGGLVGLLFGLDSGLIFMMFGGLAGGLFDGNSEEIVQVEAVRWSWITLRSELASIVFSGLAVGLVVFFGLAVGLISGWAGGLPFGLLGVPLFTLLGGLLFVLTTGLTTGLATMELEAKAVPNQGIWRSAQNALALGLVFSLVGGLPFGMVGGLTDGLAIGLLGGLIGGLLYGGRTCLQHLVLRYLLIRGNYAPPCYVSFLDYAAQRFLLRKVGGGYIFIHRLLLDYFAKQYHGPETIDVSTVSTVPTKKEP